MQSCSFIKDACSHWGDQVYELAGNEWKPFGNGFRLLGKSASGKYWLVGTEDKSIWKATF